MAVGKSICVTTLSGVLCLLAVSWASGQEGGMKIKAKVQAKGKVQAVSEAAEAADDDFRPPFPMGKQFGRTPQPFGGPQMGFPGRGPGGMPGFQPGEGPTETPGVPPGDAGSVPGAFGRPGFPGGFGPGDPGRGPGRMRAGFGMPPRTFRWPFGDWQSLEQNDPEMHKLLEADYDLERQSGELALQYRQAPEEEREAIKQKLEKLVAEHFETRQQRRRLELKRLEDELGRLRESIDKRQEAQPQIVQRRLAELLGLENEPQF